MNCGTKLIIGLLFAISAFAQAHISGGFAKRGPAPEEDLGAQVNQAFSRCADGCIVELDPGTYSFSTPIVISRPGLQLRGSGGRATHLIYTGTSGAAIDLRMNPFTIDTHDAVEGLSIELQNDNTTAFLTGDITSAIYRDLWINCEGHSNTQGIAIYLLNGWFERNLFDSIDIKYCSTDLSMSVDPLDRFTSFGYNKFLQVGLNVGDGQTAVHIGPNVMLYYSILNFNVNMDTGNENRFMVVDGISHENMYQIVGEATGKTMGIVVGPSGNWEDGQLSRGGPVHLDNMTNHGVK
jgi:hypothetical protein